MSRKKSPPSRISKSRRKSPGLSTSYTALDFETTGLEWWQDDIIATDLAWCSDQGACDVLQFPDATSRAAGLVDHLNRNNVRVVFHNAKFDLRFFRKSGLPMPLRIEDTMLLARVVHTDELSYGLKALSKKYLGELYEEEERIKKWATRQKRAKQPNAYGLAPDHIRIPYAQKDAVCTIQLWTLMWEAATKSQKRIYRNEMKVLRCVLDMEKRGLRVDLDLAGKMLDQAKTKRTETLANLRNEVGDTKFNPRSTPQLQRVVYGKGEVKVCRRTKTGKPATDRLALVQANSPIAKQILDFRAWDKLAGTYVGPLIERQDEGTIHPSWNQAGTKTGRFSSSGPNFQNLPRPGESPLGRVKDLIIARPGYRLVLIDYEQLEIRICAHFSQEPHLLEAIHSKEDIHGVTCKVVFDKTEDSPDWGPYRFYAKTLNFLLQYGGGAQKLVDTVMDQTGEAISLYRASKLKEAYENANPNVMGLFDKVSDEVTKTGGVTNGYGRFVAVPASKTYVGVNYKIQGTAADLIKFKMPGCRALLKDKRSGMVLQVHDELGFEIHKKEQSLVKELQIEMKELDKFSVPITVDVQYGQRWGRKKNWTS